MLEFARLRRKYIKKEEKLMLSYVFAIVVAIVVSMFNKETRITPKRLLEALAAGGQGMITVAAACGDRG